MKYISADITCTQDCSPVRLRACRSPFLLIDCFFLFFVTRNRKTGFMTHLLFISMILSTCACSSYHVSQLPPWVINPPQKCAMGSMRSQSSLSLTQLGAITRGRAALSHQIQSRVESIIRSYIAEGGNLKSTMSEEVFIDYSVQSTKTALQGTQAREIFVSSDPYQTLYALVCISESQVSKIFHDLSFIPPEHRTSLRQRAREAFAELDEVLPDAPVTR